MAIAAGVPAILLKMHLGRQLRREHEQHEARLRLAEMQSPDAMFTIDERGVICTFNLAAERMFGFEGKDIVGRSIGLLLPAAAGNHQPGLGLNALHQAPATDNGIGLQVMGLRKNGTSFPLDLLLTEVAGNGKRLFHALVRDLSERQRADGHEVELRFMGGLLQSVGAPVLVLDKQGRVVKCNRAFEEITDYSGAEAHGRHYWELLLTPDDWSPSKVAVAQVIASGQTEKAEMLWRTKAGEQVPMLLAMTALRAGNMAAEHAVIAGFRAPGALLAEYAGSTTMEAVERLAGGIAQQFNDLLTSINGYSELVLNSMGDKDPSRRDVEEIKRAGERAAALSHQLLVFSRKQPMRPTVMRLNDLITEMKPMLGMLLGERIQIRTTLDLAAAPVEADAGWMEQVILNLAVNARDAMPDGGNLSIETSNESMDTVTARRLAKLPAGEYVVLTISDTGCGIDPDVRARAFEPFYRAGRSKGMGLGLSTVYGVVRQSGGNVVLQSIPGSGTSVRIFLPKCAESAQDQGDKQAAGLFLVRGAGAR